MKQARKRENIMKKTNMTTYVCIPSSKIACVQNALHKDHIHDIEFYRGRHEQVQCVSMADRSKTFQKILNNCPSVTLEREAFSSAQMTRNFIGVLSVILVSNYDGTELLDYCIHAINSQ